MTLPLLSLLLACAKEPSSAAAAPPPDRHPAPASRDIGSPPGAPSCPMISWVPHVNTARDAILKNDLPVIRAELRWMAASPSLPKNLTPPVTPSSATTTSAAESDEPRAAALFLGELGVTCGGCHQGHGPSIAEPTPPTPDAGVLPHMHRHLWAIDRMWEGLMGPAELNWNQGVALLAGMDLDPSTFVGRDEQDTPAGYLAPWIRRIGVESLRTGDVQMRGRLYGDLLATCAECHAGTLGAPDPQHATPR